MFSDAAERDKGVGVCERPAPAIEADRAAEERDGLVAERIAVEGRPAEAFEPLAAATPLAVSGHAQSISVGPLCAKNPNLLGLPCGTRCSGIVECVLSNGEEWR